MWQKVLVGVAAAILIVGGLIVLIYFTAVKPSMSTKTKSDQEEEPEPAYLIASNVLIQNEKIQVTDDNWYADIDNIEDCQNKCDTYNSDPENSETKCVACTINPNKGCALIYDVSNVEIESDASFISAFKCDTIDDINCSSNMIRLTNFNGYVLTGEEITSTPTIDNKSDCFKTCSENSDCIAYKFINDNDTNNECNLYSTITSISETNNSIDRIIGDSNKNHVYEVGFKDTVTEDNESV